MKSSEKNNVIENGKCFYDSLEKEVGHLSILTIMKKIDAIRSVERGLVKRELTKEEHILKDFILRQSKTLRWAHDLLELILIPSDLQYLVETRQMKAQDALKEFHKRKNPYKHSSSYAHIIKEIKSLLVVIEDECKST